MKSKERGCCYFCRERPKHTLLVKMSFLGLTGIQDTRHRTRPTTDDGQRHVPAGCKWSVFGTAGSFENPPCPPAKVSPPTLLIPAFLFVELDEGVARFLGRSDGLDGFDEEDEYMRHLKLENVPNRPLGVIASRRAGSTYMVWERGGGVVVF